mgnify:CR=1 FL=1
MLAIRLLWEKIEPYNEKGIQAILDIAEVSRKRIKYANV